MLIPTLEEPFRDEAHGFFGACFSRYIMFIPTIIERAVFVKRV